MKKISPHTNLQKPLRFFSIIGLLLLVTCSNLCFAQAVKKGTGKPQLIPSLNAYSFNDLLMARDKRDNPVYTVFNLLDWCATQKIAAVDLTGYYFPKYPEAPSDEYIIKLKNKAKQVGVSISGTGIRNNFASPDAAVRAADVALTKKWIEVAAKLGAPVLRVFAGEIPKGYENKWDQVAGWMIECYKECAVYGEKFGVKIGIQNHGDMLQTAEQCIKVLNAVNSNWVGLIVDVGSFRTEDPYVDIEAAVPYAFNWQVKETTIGLKGAVRTDFTRLMKILRKTNYKGYLPVETLVLAGRPYDPFALVPALIRELEVAREKVFKQSSVKL